MSRSASLRSPVSSTAPGDFGQEASMELLGGPASDDGSVDVKKERGFSLAITVQGFLVVALVLVVLSITLLFHFFGVVVVDNESNRYVDMASRDGVASMNRFLGEAQKVMDDIVVFGAEEAAGGNASIAFDNRTMGLVVDAQRIGIWSYGLMFLRGFNGSVGCDSIGVESCWYNSSDCTGNVTQCSGGAVLIPALESRSTIGIDWSFVRSQVDREHLLVLRQGFAVSAASPGQADAVYEAGLNISFAAIQEKVLRGVTETSHGVSSALIVDGNVLITSDDQRELVPDDFSVVVDVPTTGKTPLRLRMGFRPTSDSIVSDLNRGTFVVIAVAVAIGTIVSVFGVLLLRILLTPLNRLREDLADACELRLDGLQHRTSFIREVDDLHMSFSEMVHQLKSYQTAWEAMGEDELFANGPSSRFFVSENPSFAQSFTNTSIANSSMATSIVSGALSNRSFASRLGRRRSTSVDANLHLIKVVLRYTSRRKGIEKKVVTFEHNYRDGDAELLYSFQDACLAHAHAHRFEEVALHTRSSAGLRVQLLTNKDLENAFEANPGEIHVTMVKNSESKLLSPISLLIDFVNFVLNVLLIFLVMFDTTTTRGQRLSITVFASFYLSAVFVNICISLWILKWSQRDKRMKVWLGQGSMEVTILLLLCGLNTQHIHFLWSQWTIAGKLKFNAPHNMETWKMCVRWSLFGFIFSDLMQVFYKLYRLFNTDGYQMLTGIMLGLSIGTLALTLPKKFRFFAIKRGKEDKDENEGEEVGETSLRQRTGQFQTLQMVEVTVLLIRLPLAAEKQRNPKRLAAAYSSFYQSVFAEVKSHGGTTLYFHATEVAAIFNAPKLLPEHLHSAIRCALNIVHTASNLLFGKPFIAMTTDLMPVGNLGSANRKNFQCIGPFDALHQMTAFGELSDCHILATARCGTEMDAKLCRWRVLPMATAEDGIVLEIRGVQQQRPRSKPPHWTQVLSPFNIRTFSADAAQVIGDGVSRWLKGGPVSVRQDTTLEDEGDANLEKEVPSDPNVPYTRTTEFILQHSAAGIRRVERERVESTLEIPARELGSVEDRVLELSPGEVTPELDTREFEDL